MRLALLDSEWTMVAEFEEDGDERRRAEREVKRAQVFEIGGS